MILYQSIVIYLLFALFLAHIGKVAYVQDMKSKPSTDGSTHINGEVIFFCFIFALISGLRFRVGVDCESYVNSYLTGVSARSFDVEPFFKLASDFMRSLSLGRVAFLGFWAFVQVFCILYALRKRKYLYGPFAWCLILGPYYLMWMNGIRQETAACIFVIAFFMSFDMQISKKQRYLSSLMLIFFATTIHRSAVMLIPIIFIIYCFPNIDLCKNRKISIAILLACAVLGQTSFIKQYLFPFEDVLRMIDGYDGYADGLSSLIETNRSISYGPRRLVILIPSILVLWYSPLLRQIDSSKAFVWCLNFFFIHQCLGQNLFSNLSSIFYRPFVLIESFSLISTAYLLYYLKRKKSLVYVLTLLTTGSYIILDNIASADIQYEASLFKFIFFY